MSKTSVVMAMMLVSAGRAFASGTASAIAVGHSEAAAVTHLPQVTMERIGQLRWFFAHASVGVNMVSGLTDLRTNNSNRYRLTPVTDDAVPPATPLSGRVYDYNRSNPGWQTKVDTFAAYITNGWCYPKVNLAFNKFCYIDQSANVNTYIQSMATLETNFPETIFVYATIPLKNTTDKDNYTRNVFNDALRSWVASNGCVLLDIADIEAHDTNGVAQMFTYSGRTCQRLYSGYTDDGGHLNALGSREVAKGFYALAAALFTADWDGDGLSDGDELIAGSSPRVRTSCFKLEAPSLTEPEVVFRWASASNRWYTLQRRDTLRGEAGWTNLLSNAVATPPMNTSTDVAARAASGFYRVIVQQ